jgi:putative endonuclease
MRDYYVYILCNKKNGVLYTGVTNNLKRRTYEHKYRQVPGFARRTNWDRLVFFEITPDVASAIQREKQIKGWLRAKKIRLIESRNPEWKDLSDAWFQSSFLSNDPPGGPSGA